LMDRFLYKGKSRSIPRLIVMDSGSRTTLGVWGPRPAEAQKLYESAVQEPDFSYQEVAEELQKWYANDRTKAIQRELTSLLRGIEQNEVRQGEIQQGLQG